MCGICCVLEKYSVHTDHGAQDDDRLQRRGPDKSTTQQILISENQKLTLSGHVLHLRGQLTPQPLTNQQGDYLLWNGEVFGGIQVHETENDTQVLLDKLSSSSEPAHILSTMADIQGPWAFVYWQNKCRRLWFARDIFGRRSLLWHLPANGDEDFILSSIKIHGKQFLEVPSIGVYCLEIPEMFDMGNLRLTVYARDGAVWPGTMDIVTSTNLRERIYPTLQTSSNVQFNLDPNLRLHCSVLPLNKNVPTLDTAEEKVADTKEYLKQIIEKDDVWNTLAEQLTNVLLRSIKTRVYNQPELCSADVNFCSYHQQQLQRSDVLQANTLSSTSMEKREVVDNPKSVNERKFSDDHGQMDVLNSVDSSSCVDSVQSAVEERTDVRLDFNKTMTLTNSECHSVDHSMKGPGTESNHDRDCRMSEVLQSKVAILFSGGIDSSVIAALVDKILPEEESVDLINVAFEQQIKSHGNKKETHRIAKNEVKTWDVPDRQTGYTALAELNPNRKWNFILVNVTLKELQEIRSEHVRHLVYPLETVLDDSIGCAIWFAARGCGVLGNGTNEGKIYKSTAKVILCGMGADEQFAGYSRHRGKFQEKGWQGLIDEIELEVTRISARNLGRDDRVITDHGKESRFPFLDENVVNFLQQLPIHQKANLTLPRGLGEKILLRVCATKLGLVNTAVFPKRAIQFGSRIAKIENNKEKASDKCERLV